MKGMKNRVMAFVLAFIMIIANVMTVAAEDAKEYWFEIYGYGENCVFKYWTCYTDENEEDIWEELDYGGFSTTMVAGTAVNEEIGDSLQIREEPTREGSRFEGWARFKVEEQVHTFMPQSSSKPYFTTEEIFNSVMPEYDVMFVPKWSDISIEDYFPTYYWTIMNANGGKVYTQYTEQQETGIEVQEYSSEIEINQQPAKQSLNDLYKNGNMTLQGVKKPGEILENWTVYEAKKIEEVYFENGETVPKDTETEKYIFYAEFEPEENAKIKVYFRMTDYKLISNTVSTDELLNSYKGAHYYAVANWKKSVELVENKEVTATLQKELEDIIAKKDTVKESVISKETLHNVEMASQAGKEIKSELVVYPVQESTIDTKEKTSIVTEVTKELGKDAKIQYLDIQVMLKADDEKLGNIHELTKEIEITIAIPEDMKAEGGKYVVLRNHNGKVDVLDVKRNSDGTVTFKTDKFSTYALAYVAETVAVAPAEPTSPKTGDTSAIVGYAALCVMALAVVVWKKKEFLVK